MADSPSDYGPTADRARRLLHRRRGPRWWALWLGVTGLLLLAALAGIAWMAYTDAEAKAARVVEQLGGRVRWTDDRPSDGRIVSVSFRSVSELKDEDLDKLTPWWWNFPALQDLDLGGTSISDAGLAHVRGAGVRNLVLNDTRITSDGLRHLAEVSDLRSLSLQGTRIDDDGLKHLSGLSRLGNLYLRDTPITDAGLRHLASLKSLRYLQLGENNGVTDSGVEELQRALPDLKVTR